MEKVLIAVICLALLTGCSNNDETIKEYEDKITNLENELEASNNLYLDDEPNRFDNSGYLYDYEKLTQYKRTSFGDIDLYEIASLLQSKGLPLLTVKMDESKLKITYELDLRYENQRYYFYYNKEMQDSIIILAVFDDIESVEFNYVIPETYSVSALPYTRKVISEEVHIDLQSYNITEEFIGTELPNLLNGCYYNPEIMRFVTFEQAIGLD